MNFTIQLISLVTLLLVADPSIPQVPSNPLVPTDPVQLLTVAHEVNGLAGDDLKPWHLKANYDVLDKNNKVIATGVFEEWWAAKDKWRRSYSGTHYTGTEYHLPEGEGHEGLPWTPVPWPESFMATKLIEPLGRLSESTEFDRATKKPRTLVSEPLAIHPLAGAKPPLSCVEPASAHGELRADDGVGYCFSPGTIALRLSVMSCIETTYNRTGKFQDRYIGLETSVGVNQHALLKIHVVSLTGMQEKDEQALKPTVSIQPKLPANEPLPIQSAVLAGHRLSGSDPVYPDYSKQHRDSGVVILSTTIDKTGHIKDLKVLESPSGELAAASLRSVQTWTYTPYLLNGQPVEVQTTVNVIFRIGG
jgi:TonB family protein